MGAVGQLPPKFKPVGLFSCQKFSSKNTKFEAGNPLFWGNLAAK